MPKYAVNPELFEGSIPPPFALNVVDAMGRVITGPNGKPSTIIYFDTEAGIVIQQVWDEAGFPVYGKEGEVKLSIELHLAPLVFVEIT